MTTKNEFGGITILDNNGALGIGSDQTITNLNQFAALDDLTTRLVRELKSAELPQLTKQDLEESINEVVKQVKSEKKNRISLGGILNGISAAMTTLTNSPALIEAYTKWKIFLEGI